MEFLWKVCPLLVIFLQHFVVLDLLMCSAVVVADQRANEGPGRWPGLEQGGDSVDSRVPAPCHCACPAQLWQLEAPGAVPELLGSPRPPGVLYQLLFTFRPGWSAPEKSSSKDLMAT